MKKQIPKFDQKAWDEKQAKSAENYSKNEKDGGLTFTPAVGAIYKYYVNGIPVDQHKQPYSPAPIFKAPPMLPGLMPTVQVPKDQLAAQYPSSGIWNSKDFEKYKHTLAGDGFDQFIFDEGGEDGERLPQGHSDNSWYSIDPAFVPAVKCCQPEDKVNVGFHMDKWACKVCGKDME